MEKHTPLDVARACKSRADELISLALAGGNVLKRGHALDKAAKEHGFRDWNAASAAAKASAALAEPPSMPSWRELERPLPSLPLRLHRAGSAFYRSISELMRWARALEKLAELPSAQSRHEMLSVIGGDLPYVFVEDYGRWGDDVFRLCDRGYNEWPGITFTREDLRAAGVFEWHEQHGSHDGDTMLTILGDEIQRTPDANVWKGLARTLAAMALVADQVFVRQEGKELPPGRGFTIDLNNPDELTAKRVASLLGSRDDSRHRQLRVTGDGIAYLSNEVGNINVDGLAFRMETWTQGKGFVGTAAAEDEWWVGFVLRGLQRNWPDPESTYIG